MKIGNLKCSALLCPMLTLALGQCVFFLAGATNDVCSNTTEIQSDINFSEVRSWMPPCKNSKADSIKQ